MNLTGFFICIAKKRLCVISLSLMSLTNTVKAQQLLVKNSESGEPIADCQVVKNNKNTLGFTNALGLISLDKVPLSANDTLSFMALGYAKKNLAGSALDTISIVRLTPLSFDLNEVVVEADRFNKLKIEAGKVRMNPKFMEKLPTVFGEPDLFKNFQLLPGVSSAMENNTGIYVRGGASNQTLILVDGAPLFNSSHSIGFFSALQPATVKNATLYKNGIPPEFGTRASAILDLELHNGSEKDFHGAVRLGIISSALNLKGPIQRSSSDNPNSYLTYQFSARATYIDKFLELILTDEDQFFKTGFEDYSLKLYKQIDLKRSIQFSWYRSDDRFEFPQTYLLSEGQNSNWHNNLFNLKYMAERKEGRVHSYKLYFSQYSIENEYLSAFFNNNISNLGLKWTVRQTQNGKAKQYGLEFNTYLIQPGRFTNKSEEPKFFEDFDHGRKEALAIAGFYNYEGRFRDSSYSFKIGGRISQFNEFLSVQPRLVLQKNLPNKQSLSISYDRMAQFINLYSANVVDLPTDIWYPSNGLIPPTISNSLSLDYGNKLSPILKANLSLYIRNFKNAKDVRGAAPLFLGLTYEKDVMLGTNLSYGTEFLLEYDYKSINGWIGYTYSRSLNQIEGINNGEPYPANWDRPHMANFVLNHRKNSLIYNLLFTISSGRPATFPLRGFSNAVLIYSNRNEYRFPLYHRADLSISWKGSRHKHYQNTWTLSIYNFYNRKNPYALVRYDSPQGRGFQYINLFPVLPFFSLKVDFY